MYFVYALAFALGFASAAALAPFWVTILAGLLIGASFVPLMLVFRGIRTPKMLWALLMNRSNLPSNITLGWVTTFIGSLMLAVAGHVAAEMLLPRLSLPVTDFPSAWLIGLGACGFAGLRFAQAKLGP